MHVESVMLRARHEPRSCPATGRDRQPAGTTRPPDILIHPVQVRPCLLAAEIPLALPYSSPNTYSHWTHRFYFMETGVLWFCPWG